MTTAKFLIIGLGSMGKRRIRNLQYLKAGEIFGFDLRADRCQETEGRYGIKTCTNLDEAMGKNPDMLIISTPPDKHIEYALIAARNNKHFFTEVNVLPDGLDELIALCRGKSIVAAPSCTMRFHPAIKDIKNLVKSGKFGKVTNFSYHSGQYLPDWHPWESVKDFYVGRKETGGCREIVPFELTWIVDILGFPKNLTGFYGKTMDVGADIDDTYVIALDFGEAYGNLMIDVTSRYGTRSLILNMERGQILWRWDENVVKVYDAVNQRWIHYRSPEGQAAEGYNKNITEDMYVEEIKSFIEAVNGKGKFPNSLDEDIRVLGLLQKIEARQ